jgi:hypothetical protein
MLSLCHVQALNEIKAELNDLLTEQVRLNRTARFMSDGPACNAGHKSRNSGSDMLAHTQSTLLAQSMVITQSTLLCCGGRTREQIGAVAAILRSLIAQLQQSPESQDNSCCAVYLLTPWLCVAGNQVATDKDDGILYVSCLAPPFTNVQEPQHATHSRKRSGRLLSFLKQALLTYHVTQHATCGPHQPRWERM